MGDFASEDKGAFLPQPKPAYATWPRAIRWDRIESIVTRCESLPESRQRERLRAVLERVQRPAHVLESLDREARRLFAEDRDAAQAIRRLLEPLARGAPVPSWATREGSARIRQVSALLRSNSGGFPCPPGDGVIDPIGMMFVAEAAQYAAGADSGGRAAFAGALDFLWLEAERLDPLARYATDGSPVGDERLEAHLAMEGDRLGYGGREPLTRDGFGPTGRPPTGPPLEGGIGPGRGGWIPEGDPNTGPGFPGPGGPGFDPCGIVDEAIRGHGLGKVHVGISAFRPVPIAVKADTITAITPNQACPGELITIHGSGFGSSKPSNVDVVLDCKGPLSGMVLEVITWSATEIVVRVPVGAGSGCIGFRDRNLEAGHQQMVQDQYEFFGVLNTVRAMQGLPPLEVPTNTAATALPTPIPCTGVNRFLGTLPEILSFESNANLSVIGQPPTLQPGVALELSWKVENATAVRIRRTSAQGPALPAPPIPGWDALGLGTLVGSSGKMDLGPFTENTPVVAVYELTAENRCGTVKAETTVALRATPNLRVRGIEVVQTVQTFNLAGLAPRNTVRLRARHRTLARVYFESGLSGGFNFGAGADRLPVTWSEMRLTSPSLTWIS